MRSTTPSPTSDRRPSASRSFIRSSLGLAVFLTCLFLWGVEAHAQAPRNQASQTQAPNTAGAQRVVVPLTKPGQPVVLSASLVHGTIEVAGYEGGEVVVEAIYASKGCDDCDDDSDEESDDDSEDNSDWEDDSDGEDRRRTEGMRRIPNLALGLVVEERNNRVEVSSESWNRSVKLKIQVPRNTSLRLGTVNGGDIRVSGVSGEHELQNTNGAISALDMRGSVVANTTNGDVEVRLLEIAPDKAMSFTTWNGDVDISFPSTLAGVFLMNPGRGEIFTDFDLQMLPVAPEVRTNTRREGYRVEMKQEVKGKVGNSTREMHFRTFNGSIYIRRVK